MAGRIDERDLFALRRHRVGADALRNAARFTRRDGRGADFVEQRGLTVVDVAHHRDDRRTGDQIPLVLFRHNGILQNFFRRLFRFVFKVDSHIRRQQRRIVVIDGIVDALHDSFLEQPFGNLHRRNSQFFRKHFQRNFLRRDHRMIDLDGGNLLFLLLLGNAELSVARLILVEILHRHALLFDEGALGNEFLFDIRLIERLFLGRRALLFGKYGSRRAHPAGASGRRSVLEPAGGPGRSRGPRAARRTGRTIGAGTIGISRGSRIHIHPGFRDINALFLSVAEISRRTRRGRSRRARGSPFGRR